jgi:hypothetical protein
VSAVRDEDFNLGRWCDCAIGHAMKDAYVIAQEFDPMLSYLVGHSFMGEIGKFFDISAARAAELFIPDLGRKYQSRKQVLAALRVLLLEKQMVQKFDDGAKPARSTPHIEELADA